MSIRLAMLHDGAMVGAHTEPTVAWAAEARSAAETIVAADSRPRD
ncbi:hypothetical protein [Curtobacterium ammoniigenes]|nr:hypothetical protein [Curtobacterium ammoniigenes]